METALLLFRSSNPLVCGRIYELVHPTVMGRSFCSVMTYLNLIIVHTLL
jgi:hypothetical protein